MAEVDLVWVGEHRYLAVDSSKHSVILSPPNDIGMKPSEMLLVSLAACTTHDIINILQKQRINLERFQIHVTAEQASEPPWKYQHIHLHFTLKGAGLKHAQVERAIDLSMNQYCSVRASLAPDIPVTSEIELLSDEDTNE